MFDRMIATMLGAPSGALLYFGFHFLSSRHGIGSGHWSWPGPVRWFVLAGAVIGFVGGRDVAERLWSNATDELREDARWGIGTGAVILVFVLIVAAGLFFATR